jgi:hypothetical protein
MFLPYSEPRWEWGLHIGQCPLRLDIQSPEMPWIMAPRNALTALPTALPRLWLEFSKAPTQLWLR